MNDFSICFDPPILDQSSRPILRRYPKVSAMESARPAMASDGQQPAAPSRIKPQPIGFRQPQQGQRPTTQPSSLSLKIPLQAAIGVPAAEWPYVLEWQAKLPALPRQSNMDPLHGSCSTSPQCQLNICAEHQTYV
ncbi:hypothetical protein O181_017573 [Austropuccinia psidii MF-1]|uniref:Uncharacterized protein n=1 Tax=Austropuccinia psidii MF-1 TaxID=1389203 RepID=A0A9Q3C6B5_9BASI|nr:hypothetical protein [Austropuccinia psidii MF-1]